MTPKPDVTTVDGVIASYPRSGRTWLAGMIGDVLRQSLQLPVGHRYFVNTDAQQDLEAFFTQFGPDAPPIPARLATHKLSHSTPRADHLVIVVRDPFDSLVSYYHYTTKLRGEFSGDMDDFLGSKNHGVTRLAEWFNSWASRRTAATVVTYERLRTDTAVQLGRALDGLGIDHDVDLDVVARRWNFEDRQAREIDRTGESDVDSRFVRRGEVGTGRLELSPAQIVTIETNLGTNLTAQARAWMSDLSYEIGA